MHTLIRSRALAFLLGMMTLWLCDYGASAQQGRTRRYIARDRADGRPLTNAVLAGDTLYISGRVAPATKTPDELEKSIRNMLDALQGTLKESGMTMDDLVWVQVFCPDVSLYDKFNDVYRTYFASGTY